jgi:hypothetical protein
VDSGCSVQEKQEVYMLFTMSSKNHHPCWLWEAKVFLLVKTEAESYEGKAGTKWGQPRCWKAHLLPPLSSNGSPHSVGVDASSITLV